MNRTGIGTLLFVLLLLVFVNSCSGPSDQVCHWVQVSILPQNATADHLAAVPGNQVHFEGHGTSSPGCVTTAVMNNVTNLEWSTSDPVNTTIVSTPDNGLTNGVATCVGRTTTPATITGRLTADRNAGVALTATTTLTCN